MMTLKFIKYCEDSSQLVESSSKYYILDVTIVLSIYKLRTFSCVDISGNQPIQEQPKTKLNFSGGEVATL